MDPAVVAANALSSSDAASALVTAVLLLITGITLVADFRGWVERRWVADPSAVARRGKLSQWTAHMKINDPESARKMARAFGYMYLVYGSIVLLFVVSGLVV